MLNIKCTGFRFDSCHIGVKHKANTSPFMALIKNYGLVVFTLTKLLCKYDPSK